MNAILSADLNWAIGYKGELLMRVPEDMKQFKLRTLGNVIVMGRKTFESLPGQRPLKDRINIVITRDIKFEDDRLVVAHSAKEVFDKLKDYDKEVFVIGGGQIYDMFLPFCEKVYVTKFHKEFKADTYFENLDENKRWELTQSSSMKEYKDMKYQFIVYQNKKAGSGVMRIENEQIEGINAVFAVINSERKILNIFVSESAKTSRMKELLSAAESKYIKIEFVPKHKLDNMSITHYHHGVIAMVAGEPEKLFEDVVDEVFEKEENPLFVLLDGVQDPHNLGAIIRTAECAGASCVVIPERRSAKVTAVAANASAGAINLIPVANARNMNRAIEYLQKLGVWVIGTATGGKNYDEADYKGKMAIVMGSEGDGLHRLTQEKCDDVVGIKMYGKTSSLNVSVAAGIVLFEAAKQRAKGV